MLDLNETKPARAVDRAGMVCVQTLDRAPSDRVLAVRHSQTVRTRRSKGLRLPARHQTNFGQLIKLIVMKQLR